MSLNIDKIKEKYRRELEKVKFQDKAFKKITSILKGVEYKKFLDFIDTEEGKEFVKKVNTALKEKIKTNDEKDVIMYS